MGQLGYRLGLIVVAAIAYFTVIKPELEAVKQSFNQTTQTLTGSP